MNEAGYESTNDLMTTGRVLPWLQDRVDVDVWRSWAVTYRDVILLDADGRPVAVYNLTLHDLSDPANQATLKQLLRDARAP
ncbi:MAG: hypothetical protein AMXMBFR34_25340 [Myxococcaceae bacterium]